MAKTSQVGATKLHWLVNPKAEMDEWYLLGHSGGLLLDFLRSFFGGIGGGGWKWWFLWVLVVAPSFLATGRPSVLQQEKQQKHYGWFDAT